MKSIAVVTVLATSFMASLAWSQKLPPPSRTVYKCESNGKTVYSDSPCLGATRVDVEPTRGVSKLSGAERVGQDVRKERTDEAVAEALRPVFNESAEQRALRHRRARLKPEARTECYALDAKLSGAEAAERRAGKEERAAAQSELYWLRT